MIDKEAAELRRRLRPDRSNITKIHGCYINQFGEIVTTFDDSMAMLPVEEQEKSAPSLGRTIGGLFRGFIRFIRQTTFIVTREEDTVFTMPTLVFAILLFFFWEVLAPVMIVALFFGVRYSFDGEEEAEKANSILHKAGDFAEDVRSEFTKKDNEE